MADGSGRSLARLARLLRLRRDVAEGQLAAAFPDRDAKWVKATARNCYLHFGREVAEIARLFESGTTGLSAGLRLDAGASEHIERMKAGVGTIVVTGHLGNWEIAGAYLSALGVPAAAVVKRQSNARFDSWLQSSRRRSGVEPIYMEDAARAVPGLLRTGTSVAIVADQAAGGRGNRVTFFGRPASTFRGPARLALATGAPLVYGSLLRDGGEYRMAIESCDVYEGSESGPRKGREHLLTESWVRRLETRVRQAPEQYLWFHRRWKGVRTNEETQP
jgi:KDO2-lipid IV(A) lauroyltransferase